MQAPQPARPPSDRVTITPASFRRHWREATSAATFALQVILTFIFINVGLDLHAIRRAEVDQLQEMVKFREAYATKYDAFLWRLDTLAESMGSTNKVLADALVRMRAQVKETTDKSAQTARATVQVAAAATKQADATSELVQQVTDTTPKPPSPAPAITVQPAPVNPASVVVQAPAAAHPPAQPAARPRRRRRWFHLWLW